MILSAGFSESRDASTQPADPPPTITTSGSVILTGFMWRSLALRWLEHPSVLESVRRGYGSAKLDRPSPRSLAPKPDHVLGRGAFSAMRRRGMRNIDETRFLRFQSEAVVHVEAIENKHYRRS